MLPETLTFRQRLLRWIRSLVIGVLLLVIAAAIFQIVRVSIDMATPLVAQTSPSGEEPLAASARVSNMAPVVGVSVEGHYRAYPLLFFMRPDRHVLNDLLGDVPITVTYCDLDDCVRIFTAPTRGQALAIAVNGADPSRPRKMLLQIEAARYWQDTGLPLDEETAVSDPFPYAEAPFVRTTWGQWREAHPDTEHYVGEGQVTTPANEP